MQGLNVLMSKYGAKGLQVVAVACDQFDFQSPGTATEIANSFKYVRPGNMYTPSFPILDTLKVNGKEATPLFRYLKTACPESGTTVSVYDSYCTEWSPVMRADVAWNFEKFLVSRNGTLVARYPTTTEPVAMEKDIEALLM
eukprot:TRINITY_DN7908_c0_g1_i1.p2 TRINITY_DN7908_c0_g1~~TRINITY_DN7908_c0_g1_i1.p2  ORF type:complete len:141 (+),score=25.01 TRINITY_DN7908_c0_g1_i1:242-664(+)